MSEFAEELSGYTFLKIFFTELFYSYYTTLL